MLIVAGALASLAWGATAKTKRVSVKSNGGEVNTDSEYPAVSADGRFVAFESDGRFTKHDDGPPADYDVFVHDRRTGKTQRVSVKSNGKEAPGANSAYADISGNGRFVSFTSDGALTGGDGNGMSDVYVHDRRTGATKRMSVTSAGGGVPYGSYGPAISNDGRFVAFQSQGAFVPRDMNGLTDIYVHNRRTGKTRLASLRSNGAQPDQICQTPSISGDGRLVAFQTYDEQMTPDTDNALGDDSDVFVRNMKNHRTTRMSLKSNGMEPDPLGNSSYYAAISANGRFVAFSADYFGVFVPADNNGDHDVYVHDRKTGKTQLVSVTSNEQPGNEPSGVDAPAAISASGRFVAFESSADLVPSDGNGYRDIYMRDRAAGKTKRISLKSNGKPVNGYAHQLPAISGDGRFVAFSSMGKFTGGDAGNDFDVFERGPLR